MKTNPYDMDDPNIDAEDYECTDDAPCGKCDVCEENDHLTSQAECA